MTEKQIYNDFFSHLFFKHTKNQFNKDPVDIIGIQAFCFVGGNTVNAKVACNLLLVYKGLR